jgi:hypothetical protein
VCRPAGRRGDEPLLTTRLSPAAPVLVVAESTVKEFQVDGLLFVVTGMKTKIPAVASIFKTPDLSLAQVLGVWSTRRKSETWNRAACHNFANQPRRHQRLRIRWRR